jgi:hypothetical protein
VLESRVPNDLWNALGALVIVSIVTAMLTIHPVQPSIASSIESRVALNWRQAEKVHGMCPEDFPCLVPFQAR